MRTRMLTTALVATASLAVLCGAAGAQSKTPTTADFEACNLQATAKLGSDSGSALPRSTTPGSGTSSSMPSVGSQSPDTGASSSSSGTSGSGATGSGTIGSGISSGSGMSGAGSTRDHSLMGIDAAKRGDPAYQAAYQDCMKTRGF